MQREYTLESIYTPTQNIEQFISEGIAQFQEFSERLRPFCTDIFKTCPPPTPQKNTINNKRTSASPVKLYMQT